MDTERNIDSDNVNGWRGNQGGTTNILYHTASVTALKKEYRNDLISTRQENDKYLFPQDQNGKIIPKQEFWGSEIVQRQTRGYIYAGEVRSSDQITQYHHVKIARYARIT
ncbi:19456_t:CDS:2 [Funneliformis geosporum]|nr:19456_t:CDS:2 [Funneliformis geosporum]